MYKYSRRQGHKYCKTYISWFMYRHRYKYYRGSGVCYY